MENTRLKVLRKRFARVFQIAWDSYPFSIREKRANDLLLLIDKEIKRYE